MKLGNVLVIYHAKCLDGFSAAVVMKHWLLEEGHALDEITLHPGVYGEPPPEIEGDTAVAVLDFSYSMEIMRELARRHRSLFDGGQSKGTQTPSGPARA